MRRLAPLVIGLAVLAAATKTLAGELQGPARFCGDAPIIDLLEGENITTLDGGIHGGSFRWDGPFGTLNVTGIGWAAKPGGRVALKSNSRGVTRFKEIHREGEYVVAIWNRRHGAAYFKSKDSMTQVQLAAIDRVYLFDEAGPQPEGCDLRTMFVWE